MHSHVRLQERCFRGSSGFARALSPLPCAPRGDTEGEGSRRTRITPRGRTTRPRDAAPLLPSSGFAPSLSARLGAARDSRLETRPRRAGGSRGRARWSSRDSPRGANASRSSPRSSSGTRSRSRCVLTRVRAGPIGLSDDRARTEAPPLGLPSSLPDRRKSSRRDRLPSAPALPPTPPRFSPSSLPTAPLPFRNQLASGAVYEAVFHAAAPSDASWASDDFVVELKMAELKMTPAAPTARPPSARLAAPPPRTCGSPSRISSPSARPTSA